MFYHRLCGHLGGMTVAEMLERMSPMEIADWRCFFEADTTESRLLHENPKASPKAIAESVWQGPEQRAAAAEDDE